jgi:hypothetical protein
MALAAAAAAKTAVARKYRRRAAVPATSWVVTALTVDDGLMMFTAFSCS